MNSAGEQAQKAVVHRLEKSFRDLGFAVKQLQLYPASSPVVQQAVQRAYGSFEAAAVDGVAVEVTPNALRAGEVELAGSAPIMQFLASRLHGHGVARIFLDQALDERSVRVLAELIGAERADLDSEGGIDAALHRKKIDGIFLEMLELERLFDEESEGDAVEDVWDGLLRGFADAQGIEDIDWEALAGNVDRLSSFVSWLMDNVGELPGFEELDSEQTLRTACRHLGRVTGALGSEHVNFLVLAIRDLAGRVDPGVFAEVLADPLEIDVAVEPSQPDERAPRGAEDEEASATETLDLTERIAQSLDSSQAEELVVHSLQSHDRSSIRLYGLFHRLTQGRDDREEIARNVRAALDQEVAGEGEGDFLENWPRLNEVLLGEAPRRFITAGYDAMLQKLAATSVELETEAEIRARLPELSSEMVLRRKAHILALVSSRTATDEDYLPVVDALEEALPELVAQDRYDDAEFILRTLTAHASPVSDRPEAQKERAAEVLHGFYTPERVEQLVRDALGRPEEEIDILLRIFLLGGRDAIPVLIETMATEETRRIRERLVKLLPALGREVVDQVAQRLDDQRWYFVRNLVLVLGEIADPRFVDELGETLRHRDVRVRREAARALVKIGGGSVAAPLRRVLDDEDLGVRLIAIHGIGHSGARNVSSRLRPFLALSNWRGQNNELVMTAAIALGRLGDTEVEEQLQRLAGRPWLFAKRRRPVQRAASWALDRLRGRRGYPAPELPELEDLEPVVP